MLFLPRTSTTNYWRTWRKFNRLAGELQLTPWDRSLAWRKLTGNEEMWEWPVPIRSFVHDPFYMGQNVTVRAAVTDFIGEFADPDNTYETFLFIAGLGSGKSFSAALLLVYAVYLLSCLRDPQRYLRGFPGVGIGPDAEIVALNASGAGLRQAKRIVYEEVAKKIEDSPYFQRYYPPLPGRSNDLEFEHRIRFSPGTSEWRSVLGWNVFAFVVDEAAFGVESERADYVAELFRNLDMRRRSRFDHLGFGGLFTSPGREYGYVEDLARDAGNWDRSILVRRITTWESKGELRAGTPIFLLDTDPDALRVVEEELLYVRPGVAQRKDGALVFYDSAGYRPPMLDEAQVAA